ncbi:type II secretion system protein GspM [Acidovorax sp. LjRoot194]|uniref:type II secretion system protein GspM n=1 Tax=Acidovorax sp. LjRoot194 TaxID=3342280 RepID=UPI003ECCE7A5
MNTRTSSSGAALRARWNALAAREQNLVLAASGLVAFALLWWVAVAPALATLRAAPARHAELDAQLQHMQSLRTEAQQLQSTPRNTRGDSVGALRAALAQRLGNTAQINVIGDRATVTLKGAPADALGQWLAQARSNARASPIEARLARSTAAAPAAANGAAAPVVLGGARAMPRWDGTLVLALPPAQP